jgi:dihydrolipoamide dehydrogenase
MADTSFDIIVIGSGPGGYVCAIRAAQLGFKTAIVERDYLGGICLNWGCIPTKALLRSAEIFHYLQHANDYGLSAGEIKYDPSAVVKRSRAVSKRLNDGVGFLMKKNKIPVIWGEDPAVIRPSTSSLPPAPGRGCCRDLSPTRS